MAEGDLNIRGDGRVAIKGRAKLLAAIKAKETNRFVFFALVDVQIPIIKILLPSTPIW